MPMATPGRAVAGQQPPRLVRCRYLRLSGEQCTGEAADPQGDVLLCTKHLARAVALVQARKNRAK